MGRQQYLERLALGRSAFEDPHPDPGSFNQEHSTSQAPVAENPTYSQLHRGGYQQQYDTKGRPINPATEDRNARMRNAQNAVLALVGVVESRDNAERSSEMKFRYIRQAREETLKAEQDRGEDLDLVLKILHTIVCCWPDALTARVQAGVYSSFTPFAAVVLKEIRSGMHRGLGGFFATFLPGAPAMLASALLRLLYLAVVGEGEMRLLEWLIQQRYLRRVAVKRVYRILEVVSEVLFLAVDIALLPLDYHATAQQLGLAPAWPLVPSWQSFSPSSPASFHRFIWKPFIAIPVLRHVCSPAALLIMRTVLKRDQGDDETQGDETEGEQVPLAGQFTSFRYPAINAPPSNIDRPYLRQDPLGWILFEAYLVRHRALQWYGWNVRYVKHSRSEKYTNLENNHVPRSSRSTSRDDDQSLSDDEDDGLHHAHRSTALAHMPAHHIANYIDGFLTRLLMVPSDSLVFRAVACSFLASALPKTALAISAGSSVYAPFGGGPLARLSHISGSIWESQGARNYLSKLGLSLALHSSTDIALFFLVYRIARWQGKRNFNWGQAITANIGQWNRVVYRLSGERPDPHG